MKQGAWKASLGVLLSLGMSFSQDFDVKDDASNGGIVLQGKNINPSLLDNIGVAGYSVPTGNYGVGVQGTGGWIGVRASSTSTSNTGVGARYGLNATARGGSSNYGVLAYADGSGTNYAVCGIASGTNSRAGYFSGDLEYTGALVHTSDRKLKKNILELKNSLAIINRLAPKEYDYRADEFPGLNLPKNHQAGLVAQEVAEALPELVHESVMPNDPTLTKDQTRTPMKADTYMTVDYMGLIPYLVGAIQEQSAEIEKLKKRLGGD